MAFFSFRGAQPEIVKTTCAHKPLAGKKIVFVTDVHHCKWFSLQSMRKLCSTVQSLAPDLLLVGGDNAESLLEQTQFLDVFSEIHAPMGRYCVPGNNDLRCVSGDRNLLRSLCAEYGFTLLCNQYVHGNGFLLGGADDAKSGSPSAKSLPEEADEGEFVILLSHSPCALRKVLMTQKKVTKPDLILCGHTHGGQFALGSLTPYSLGMEKTDIGCNPYFRVTGETTVRGSRLIVSNGIGMSKLPLRIGARPQMHLITFTE